MSLLIDANFIINNGNNNIKKKLKIEKNYRKNTGIVICIDNNYIKKLKSLNGKQQKIDFFNSDMFIEKITYFSYLSFDNKICKLSYTCIDILDIVVENTMRYLPNNLILVYYHHPLKKDKILIKNKFTKQNNTWVRKNDIEIENFTNFIKPIKCLSIKDHCNIYMKINKSTINYIKGLSKRGSFNRNNNIKQLEISGKFNVYKIDKENIHHISISSFVPGKCESASLIESNITYHTHPIEAYERNKVINGWPSLMDYCNFIQQYFESNLIVHFVISIEGLYIISLSKNFVSSDISYEKKILTKIEECKAIDKKSHKDSHWHVSEMNKLSFNGINIFNNYFFNWNNIQLFNVYFKKNKSAMT